MKRKSKTPASRSHEVATVDNFHNNPTYAAAYLDAVLEDGDQEEVMLALRRLSDAFGGVQNLAAIAKLNSTSLYRTLSPTGNPELRDDADWTPIHSQQNAMGVQVANVSSSAQAHLSQKQLVLRSLR